MSESPEETEATINVTVAEERRHIVKWTESPRRLVVIYTAIFVLAEALGAFVSIPLQAAIDAAMAFAAVNTAIFGYRIKRTTGLVMAAVFTDRLVVLTLPTTHVAMPTRLAVVALLTIGITYIATWVLGVDITAGRSDEGFPLLTPLVSRSFTSAVTVLSGFPIGWLAYQALKPDQLVMRQILGATTIPWILAIVALGLGALAEELLYRRLVAAMVQHTGQSQTPVVAAIIYGAVFLASHNVAMIALMTATGALFAWSCERTGSIKPVVAAHFIASILVFVVLAA